jgi:hypothetical protein
MALTTTANNNNTNNYNNCSNMQKDTTFTKIFVGGLPYHTTDQTLRNFFEPFGEISEAVVITDRQTGKSRGYGFVTMADEAAAQRACKDPNPIIDGRKANVNLAYLGAKPRLPVGDILAAAAFPYALKAAGAGGGGGGMPTTVYPIGEIIGLPQWLYPSPATAPSTATAFLPATGPAHPASLQTAALQLQQQQQQLASPHSPLLSAHTLTAFGHPFIDYNTLAAVAGLGVAGYTSSSPAGQQLAAFEAFPGTACPSGLGGAGGGFLTPTFYPTAAGAPPVSVGNPPSLPPHGHQLYRPLSIHDRI